MVLTVRALVAGRWEWFLIAREYARSCGAEADSARLAIRLFIEHVAGAGRRTLAISQPDWGRSEYARRAGEFLVAGVPTCQRRPATGAVDWVALRTFRRRSVNSPALTVVRRLEQHMPDAQISQPLQAGWD